MVSFFKFWGPFVECLPWWRSASSDNTWWYVPCRHQHRRSDTCTSSTWDTKLYLTHLLQCVYDKPSRRLHCSCRTHNATKWTCQSFIKQQILITYITQRLFVWFKIFFVLITGLAALLPLFNWRRAKERALLLSLVQMLRLAIKHRSGAYRRNEATVYLCRFPIHFKLSTNFIVNCFVLEFERRSEICQVEKLLARGFNSKINSYQENRNPDKSLLVSYQQNWSYSTVNKELKQMTYHRLSNFVKDLRASRTKRNSHLCEFESLSQRRSWMGLSRHCRSHSTSILATHQNNCWDTVSERNLCWSSGVMKATAWRVLAESTWLTNPMRKGNTNNSYCQVGYFPSHRIEVYSSKWKTCGMMSVTFFWKIRRLKRGARFYVRKTLKTTMKLTSKFVLSSLNGMWKVSNS